MPCTLLRRYPFSGQLGEWRRILEEVNKISRRF